MDLKKPAFNEAVDTILGESKAISDQRGGEYNDTWALENVHTTYLDATLRALGPDKFPTVLTTEEKRLLIVAALVDVKASRLLGPYKEDSVTDAINYMSAYAYWRRQYGK